MLHHKKLQPSLAGAGYSANYRTVGRRYEGASFYAANEETDSFGTYEDESFRQKPKARPQPKKPASKKKQINPKSLIIMAASLVAVILLIIVIVAVASSSGKDIKYENNSFVSYCLVDGTYQVAMNGKPVGTPFSNPITLTESADKSFAYVEEETTDGINVYILKDNKLESIVDKPVTEVLARADLVPGVVCSTVSTTASADDVIYLYTENNFERIVRDATATDFVISPDAEAVAYTVVNKDDPSTTILYLFRDGIPVRYITNMTPEFLSNDGKFLYASCISSADGISRMLYVLTSEKSDGRQKICETGFDSILYENTKGNEIIYCTGNAESGYMSFIYRIGEDEPIQIGAGKCEPLLADHSIVRLAALNNIVVENKLVNTQNKASATYRINKKYKAEPIAGVNGQLSPNGKTFYYLSGANGDLMALDINDKNMNREKIYTGVKEFVVTAKNNFYLLLDDNTLVFFKQSTGDKEPIAYDVTNMSMYYYANTLFFDVENDTTAYCSEEGSKLQAVKFGRSEIAKAPIFLNSANKRTFAIVFNDQTGAYDLYYTSNGKSFRVVSEECSDVNGIDWSATEQPSTPETPTPETPTPESPTTPETPTPEAGGSGNGADG